MIDVLAAYEREGGAAAELRLVIDERDTIQVVGRKEVVKYQANYIFWNAV